MNASAADDQRLGVKEKRLMRLIKYVWWPQGGVFYCFLGATTSGPIDRYDVSRCRVTDDMKLMTEVTRDNNVSLWKQVSKREGALKEQCSRTKACTHLHQSAV